MSRQVADRAVVRGERGERGFDGIGAASRHAVVLRGHFWFRICVHGQTPPRRGGAVIEPIGRAPAATETM